MDHQIHLYMAVAEAQSALRHAPGELHPLLIFLRQEIATDHDFAAAAAVAERAGWTRVDFTKAGILPDDAGEHGDAAFLSCHAAAVQRGDALLVYDTVVRPAPRKS